MGGKQLYFKSIKTTFPNFIRKGNVLGEPLKVARGTPKFPRGSLETTVVMSDKRHTYAPTSAIITLRNVPSTSDLSPQIDRYICTYTRDSSLNTNSQHTRTRSAAARPPRRMCYRPAVLFRHLPLIYAFVPARHNSARVQKVIISIF